MPHRLTLFPLRELALDSGNELVRRLEEEVLWGLVLAVVIRDFVKRDPLRCLDLLGVLDRDIVAVAATR